MKVNELLNGYRKAVRERLSTQEGLELYKRRGREKVELEVGLLCLAYNLKKWAKSIQKRTQEGVRRAA